MLSVLYGASIKEKLDLWSSAADLMDHEVEFLACSISVFLYCPSRDLA